MCEGLEIKNVKLLTEAWLIVGIQKWVLLILKILIIIINNKESNAT